MKVPVQIFASIAHEHGLPQYETGFASGMDVRANTQVTLEPKETKLIPTGIHVAIPEGYEIQVRPRSGMSLKTALRVANAPGTIDADYRGEICIIAQNTHGSIPMTIGKGERIAQLVLQEVPRIEWAKVDSLDELGKTVRGAGAFGSTGVA
jgi:dUTP pyrophosphatase